MEKDSSSPGSEVETGISASELLLRYSESEEVKAIATLLSPAEDNDGARARIHLDGLAGSSASLLSAALFSGLPVIHVVVLAEKNRQYISATTSRVF
jgi:hypothetical protein